MAGIYIHIPFCKSKCSYCNFYSSIQNNSVDEFVPFLINELKLRKDYLIDKQIDTIYFGGGTPSTLSIKHYNIILEKISNLFTILPKTEITIEANPDDLNTTFLSELYKLGINRLSIGVQSFNNYDLIKINRRHTAKKALEVINTAQKVGFKNISIDLIYGLPNQTVEDWLKNIKIATQLPIQHLSIYGLSYELNTPLWQQLQKGKITAISDDEMNEMYRMVIEECNKKEFYQYEISNFAKKGFHSKHNSSYWDMIPYLGLGPSAHSFNGSERQWNIPSITQYQNAINNNQPYFEKEILTKKDKINEFIMLSLRKTEGLSLDQIEREFGLKIKEKVIDSAKKYILNNDLYKKKNRLSLTFQGILISNQIMADLMLD